MEKVLKGEKAKSLEQIVLIVNETKNINSSKNASKHLQFQVTATKTVYEIHQKNEEQLHTDLKNTLDENPHLQRRIKLLS